MNFQFESSSGSVVKTDNTLYRTNNYSIISKYSASKLNYFKDPILEDFVESELDIKSWRRTPLVNRGYAARMMAVDWAVKRQTSIQTFIILGAGYDMLSLRNNGLRVNSYRIEIDLPEVIEAKSKTKLFLVACDMRNQQDLRMNLSNILQHIKPNELHRVAVLNEVCLCYVEPFEVRQILTTIIESLAHVGNTQTLTYIGYEQVRPSETSSFGHFMSDHFKAYGYPLKYFPTKVQLSELFKEHLNFQHLTICSMYQLWHNALISMRTLAPDEPFDEFEEMDLYLSHYSLVVGALSFSSYARQSVGGSTGGDSPPGDDNTDELCAQLDSQLSIGNQTASRERVHVETQAYIERYGHASCALNLGPGLDQVALINGGFGLRSTQDIAATGGRMSHQRQSDWLVIKRNSPGVSQQIVTLNPVGFPSSDEVSHFRMHGQICNPSPGYVFKCGGRDSPAPKRNENNMCVARVTGENELMFVAAHNEAGARWRHRAMPLEQGKVLTVGGRTAAAVHEPRSFPSVSIVHLDRCLESTPLNLTTQQDSLFARHSFGMDLIGQTFLVFGGLKSRDLLDRPMDFGQGALLLDIRDQQGPSILGYLAAYYDSQVHFVNDFQFINLGGVSTMTGEPNDSVELYDLRMANSTEPIVREPLQPQLVAHGLADGRFIPTKQTSIHYKQDRQIMTIGGGGNYFTFGTHFNRQHLFYDYSALVS